MSAPLPVLSRRAVDVLEASDSSLLAGALRRTLANSVRAYRTLYRHRADRFSPSQYSTDNPEGVINAGLAENVRLPMRHIFSTLADLSSHRQLLPPRPQPVLHP
jgi:hypothetical protein